MPIFFCAIAAQSADDKKASHTLNALQQIRQGKAQRRCHHILHYLLQLLLLQEGKQHSSTLKEERLSKANTNRSNPQTNKYLKG